MSSQVARVVRDLEEAPALRAAQTPEISDELPDLGRRTAGSPLMSSQVARVVRDPDNRTRKGA